MRARPALRGIIHVPGDKSITHRAIMFGAVAQGESIITTSVLGRDNFATLRIMRQLGVSLYGEVTRPILEIAREEGFDDFVQSATEHCIIRVYGKGFQALKPPAGELNCGNSGTTARLLTGLLAGRPFQCSFTGDASLRKRPFRRVVEPLSRMGASFSADLLPFTLTGNTLQGIEYVSPHASAQVKSAILLAGLQASGKVSVTEPRLSRDHTERMLSAMGCATTSEKLGDGRWKVSLPAVEQRSKLHGQKLVVPGDFSAAAFFLVGATVFPNSDLLIQGVGFNETRIGLYHILKRMGADISVENRRLVGGETVVDLHVRSANLRGVHVGEEDVVLAVDEIPVLLLAAAMAEGRTDISGAGELRVKESDRLAMTAAIVRSFGFAIEEHADGLSIEGRPELLKHWTAPIENGETWRESGDHRISMTGALFELLARGEFHLADRLAVETSFPGFDRLLRSICV